MTTLTETRKKAMGLADERLHSPALELGAQDLELDGHAAPAGPLPSRPAPRPARPDFQARARQARLRNAHALRQGGKLTTASREFLTVYRQAPDSPEGLEAAEAVTDIASEHEAAGRVRLAMELYALLADE